jgi:hypothetical protein
MAAVMQPSKHWTMVFECCHCARRFTVDHVNTNDLLEAAQKPCPKCLKAPPADGVHKLIELKEETAP